MTEVRTSEELGEVCGRIAPLHEEAMRLAAARQDRLTKPPGSLGVLEELSVRLAGITGSATPVIGGKAIVVMAADHGVANAHPVSAYPTDVTRQMVANFAKGGAAINAIASHVGARVVVVDIGVRGEVEAPGVEMRKVREGTADLTAGLAMARSDVLVAIGHGVEVVECLAGQGVNVIGTGEMGIGNTTASSAVLSVLTGLPAVELTGRGTGISDAALKLKVSLIEKAIANSAPDPSDPIDVLSKVGGLELAGLAGCMLAAAAKRMAVLVDGFISTVAALVAARIEPRLTDYLIASHLSTEPGHSIALRELGLRPILFLDMRLGEGTGAALGISVLEAAATVLKSMATFESAGISGPD